MTTLRITTPYTPDDLLEMPDGKVYELVDGILLEKNAGGLSSWVGGHLAYLITTFVEAHALGWVWPADNGYQCFPDAPDKVRRPDVSFIAKGRLTGERVPTGHLRIAPDLVVEVISPNDLAYEVDQKVLEYLDAGVRLVWVINPEARTVRIHRADGTTDWFKEPGELLGDDVLPGFRCLVADLFPPATAERST